MRRYEVKFRDRRNQDLYLVIEATGPISAVLQVSAQHPDARAIKVRTAPYCIHREPIASGFCPDCETYPQSPVGRWLCTPEE